MIQKLDENLWISECPHKMFGLHFGARMTIVRLAGGELWIHSPTSLDAPLKDQINMLGPVKYLIAPNMYHHVYIGDWKKHYPDAQLYAAPGLDKKRKDLHFHEVLSDTPATPWSGELEQVHIKGMPLFNEVVFYYQKAKTLISCDLLFHISGPLPFFTKLNFKLAGVYNRLAVSRLFKTMMFKKARTRQDIEKILEWDFERLIFSHGEWIQLDGNRRMREAYAWLVGH